MNVGSLLSVSPYSLQDERSPTLWNQRGPQLWGGRQRNCQSPGWPRRHSRQNHQQWPEEEKGNWLFGGVSGALWRPPTLCWLPESTPSPPQSEVPRSLGLRHSMSWKGMKKMVRQVTLKSPSVLEVEEKWSKSQGFCSSPYWLNSSWRWGLWNSL